MTDPLSEYRKDGNGRGVQPSARAVAFKRWYDALPMHVAMDNDVRVLERTFDAGWNARKNTEYKRVYSNGKWCVNGQPFG